MADELEESILRSLRKVSRAIDLHSRRLVATVHLTGPQLVCLRQLARGALTPSELARAVSLSNATITGILTRLEQRGLVTRERSEADRRRVHVALTERGHALVREAPSPLQERFTSALHRLPVANRTIIDVVLKQIVDMMDAGDLDASPVLATGPILAEPDAVEELLDSGTPAPSEKPPRKERAGRRSPRGSNSR